jgi:hypothetical protein
MFIENRRKTVPGSPDWRSVETSASDNRDGVALLRIELSRLGTQGLARTLDSKAVLLSLELLVNISRTSAVLMHRHYCTDSKSQAQKQIAGTKDSGTVADASKQCGSKGPL